LSVGLPGRLTHFPNHGTSFRLVAKSFFELVIRIQSAEVFLDHTQMDPKPVQVDFECACNLEPAHG
jgi:hypothetical protein